MVPPTLWSVATSPGNAVQSNPLAATAPPTKSAWMCLAQSVLAHGSLAQVLPAFLFRRVVVTLTLLRAPASNQMPRMGLLEPFPSTYSTPPPANHPPPSCRALQRCCVSFWPLRPHWRPGLRQGASCRSPTHSRTVRTILCQQVWRQTLLSLQRPWVPATDPGLPPQLVPCARLSIQQTSARN